MKKKSNLTLFMKQLIRSLKEEERFSTAHIYQSTLNAFMLFCKTDAIRFNQMERSRLKQFENHLRNKGCTWNTVSTYMRTLRSIYNKAVDDGLAEEKPRLFRHVYTGVKANTKRALDAKDMSKLLSASLPRPLPQSMKESRAWITLMFLLRGMPFVDLAPAQNRPARFCYLLPPPQNRNPAHRRDSSRCHEPYQTVSKYRLRLPLPASHSQWKPEKRRRVCRIPTCLAETEL